VRPFHLHPRKNIFYVQFVDPETGSRLTAKSTGKTNRDEALIVVYGWLNQGIPEGRRTSGPRRVQEVFSISRIVNGIKSASLDENDVKKILGALSERGFLVSASLTDAPGSELFRDYVSRFWDFESSPYVAEKRAHGQSIGRKHCLNSLQRAIKYWLPAFDGKRLSEISKEDIKKLSMSLALPEKGLTPNSRNRILVVGTTALKWAFQNGLIPADVTEGIMKFSGGSKKRGILSPEEAEALFSMQWEDKRCFLANLLAATTGLRAGEIAALRIEDIGETLLEVSHSWGCLDRLKAPKNGEARRVPIVPWLRKELVDLAKMNPHSNNFVFWGQSPDSPMDIGKFNSSLKTMLTAMVAGPNPEEAKLGEAQNYWKKRNVIFHGWRHFYASRMSDTMDPAKIMRATGHKTKAVFDEYAGHALESDLEDIGRVSSETFGKIVPTGKVPEPWPVIDPQTKRQAGRKAVNRPAQVSTEFPTTSGIAEPFKVTKSRAGSSGPRPYNVLYLATKSSFGGQS
jgi:integrase